MQYYSINTVNNSGVYIQIKVAAQTRQFRLADICKLPKYSRSWGRETS